METVEVVIRLPKEQYNNILNKGQVIALSGYEKMIGKGTVLPKGHDALLDARQLMDYCHNQIEGHKYVDCNVIARFPCVIKADRGDDNG